MTFASMLSTGLLCPVDCPLYLYHVSSQQTALCGYYSCKNKINIKSQTGVTVMFQLSRLLLVGRVANQCSRFHLDTLLSFGRIAICVSQG